MSRSIGAENLLAKFGSPLALAEAVLEGRVDSYEQKFVWEICSKNSPMWEAAKIRLEIKLKLRARPPSETIIDAEIVEMSELSKVTCPGCMVGFPLGTGLHVKERGCLLKNETSPRLTASRSCDTCGNRCMDMDITPYCAAVNQPWGQVLYRGKPKECGPESKLWVPDERGQKKP